MLQIGGWGVSPTGKSFRFVRACDAKLRVSAQGTAILQWLGDFVPECPPACVACGVVVPLPCRRALRIWILSSRASEWLGLLR